MKKTLFNKPALLLITFYQKCISPFFPASCRYHPTCSEYAKECFLNYNFFYASYLTVYRILRCQPLCKGGYDPIPKK